MFEEIKVSEILEQDTIQHSKITLSDNASDDLFECKDSLISLEIDQIAYILKLTNSYTVSINIYNMTEIYMRPIQHTGEYNQYDSQNNHIQAFQVALQKMDAHQQRIIIHLTYQLLHKLDTSTIEIQKQTIQPQQRIQ